MKKLWFLILCVPALIGQSSVAGYRFDLPDQNGLFIYGIVVPEGTNAPCSITINFRKGDVIVPMSGTIPAAYCPGFEKLVPKTK